MDMEVKIVFHGINKKQNQDFKEESDMWNTKSDTFGWNLNRDTSNINYHCNFCKENNKCAMSSLLHCDYRKDGKCTQCKGK